ncbi:MAG: helix-turn-helix domain-containing protein [Acidimicrobiales bacterium]|nr:helix-turn-helix domain-containing protein [Acidimicrobiales bacterium]
MAEAFEEQVARIALLSDPVRRRLYEFVAGSRDAVSREAAAAAVDVRKPLAAFHLDKLVDAGLLDVEFRRLNGRSGPGAGRPAKLYKRSGSQLDVTLPQREYDLAGRLLAAAIDAASRSGRTATDELDRAAHEFGETMGERAAARAGTSATEPEIGAAMLAVLQEYGFEPRREGSAIVLCNCPFHALAEQSTELICGMNLRILEGMRSRLGLSARSQRPRLSPQAGRCCVTFTDDQ